MNIVLLVGLVMLLTGILGAAYCSLCGDKTDDAILYASIAIGFIGLGIAGALVSTAAVIWRCLW